MSESAPQIVRFAEDAYEAVRMFNHHTIHGAVPAPVLYDVLGHLKQLGPALQQALRQLSVALVESGRAYDLYGDADDTHPQDLIIICCNHLLDAIAGAGRLGVGLEQAQAVITGQGYHPRATD